MPSFKYQKNLTFENPKFLSDVKLIRRNNEQNYDDIEEEVELKKELYVNKFFQSFEIGFGYDIFYNNNSEIKIKEDDILIQRDFVFALINTEVLTDLNIPSVSFNIISKADWKKA